MKTFRRYLPHYVREFKIETIVGHFGSGLCLGKTRAGKSQDYRENTVRKAPFSKRFPSTRKQEAGAFKFHWFEERLRKAPFS